MGLAFRRNAGRMLSLVNFSAAPTPVFASARELGVAYTSSHNRSPSIPVRGSSSDFNYFAVLVVLD